MTGKGAAPAPATPIRTKVCYLMQQRGPGMLVKIGVTANVVQRARQLAQGSAYDIDLVAMIGGGMTAEAEFKKRFAALSVRGEWFTPDAAINAWLAAKHESKCLLAQRVPDAEFIAEHILPILLSYLGGREPTNSTPGDLAVRVIAGRLPNAAVRAEDLHRATKGAIPFDLAHGYVVDASPSALKLIKLPGDVVSIVKPEAA